MADSELNALLSELSSVNVNSDDEDGPPPPPPPRDSLVYDSPLEEAARSSKRVSVSDGKISYPDVPDRSDSDEDTGRSDRFDERGSDRFDEPVQSFEPVAFEPVAEPVLDMDVRCTVCRKEIEGDALQVLGGLYHFTCFACNGCGNKVGTDEFFDRDNKPYCVICYKKSYLPKCTRCFKSVEGRYLKALNKDFHESCFNCAVCHCVFEDGKFYEKDENAYCLKHYNELFGYTCGKCHGTITDGTAIKALGKYWHREHFNCNTCSKAFTDGKFFEVDGQPYCQEHYHSKRGTICGKCEQPIDGMCISALDKKWHQACFCCTKCKDPLKGQVMMSEGSVYCGSCAKGL